MRDDVKTGGPAFPSLDYWSTERNKCTEYGGVGMTLRDYFAAKAMQGRLAGDTRWQELDFKPVNGLGIIENDCLLAYRIADAMLAARSQA